MASHQFSPHRASIGQTIFSPSRNYEVSFVEGVTWENSLTCTKEEFGAAECNKGRVEMGVEVTGGLRYSQGEMEEKVGSTKEGGEEETY